MGYTQQKSFNAFQLKLNNKINKKLKKKEEGKNLIFKMEIIFISFDLIIF